MWIYPEIRVIVEKLLSHQNHVIYPYLFFQAAACMKIAKDNKNVSNNDVHTALLVTFTNNPLFILCLSLYH